MTAWPRVLWSEAGQITARLAWPVTREATLPPETFYAALRAEAMLAEATLYLAQALSRRDAIAWAVEAIARHGAVPAQPVLAAARAWLDDPSDAHRHAADQLAREAVPGGAEHHLATAVHFSGGSIAPPDEPAVLPPLEACGRFAGAAIIASATRTADFEEALRVALHEGERFARGERDDRWT
ncbi:DUF6931 family protein [Sphingomonas sanxanigenens]|uniref:Uncharacterized protein n=1 Tax=Sphingomonas sanxanigenens DSM 19645 = NX02 TaxID=1123269 RepID=W0AGH0_9SPHN|nr:hypothetical protein [Sphingomonas sanxanigenens]AHE55383.1 hypothetical protein NX02_18570 [Sphingomonas sanxanigenens DSM 19645 = NX02]